MSEAREGVTEFVYIPKNNSESKLKIFVKNKIVKQGNIVLHAKTSERSNEIRAYLILAEYDDELNIISETPVHVDNYSIVRC